MKAYSLNALKLSFVRIFIVFYLISSCYNTHLQSQKVKYYGYYITYRLYIWKVLCKIMLFPLVLQYFALLLAIQWFQQYGVKYY